MLKLLSAPFEQNEILRHLRSIALIPFQSPYPCHPFRPTAQAPHTIFNRYLCSPTRFQQEKSSLGASVTCQPYPAPRVYHRTEKPTGEIAHSRPRAVDSAAQRRVFSPCRISPEKIHQVNLSIFTARSRCTAYLLCGTRINFLAQSEQLSVTMARLPNADVSQNSLDEKWKEVD
ncbi:hypothetical protein BC826DRAFT_994013 [Russula brevipes]|nr:hypothetical protein BC826DRAFT_994013 [Russula brevipes]